jgi:bifunctional NMN adenylyltransferase/nudix hydrolase
MNKAYDTIVFIARVQPLHNSHLVTIQRAANLADNVIVIIGSANQPRTYKNPWTDYERAVMVKDACSEINCFPFIETCNDHPYDDAKWAQEINSIVGRYKTSNGKIGLIGHIKDASSFYLKMFPEWELIEQPLIDQLHATNIRDAYFNTANNITAISNVIPQATCDFLSRFKATAAYNVIADERTFLIDYQQSWDAAPYPVNLVCVDAVVVKNNHVLLVNRNSYPGKGLMALPGGYLNINETAKTGMLRELVEETTLVVSEDNIIKYQIFDHPTRSARGRVITIAYLIKLENGILDTVVGSDDAELAVWVPIDKLDRSEMFEDHYSIIEAII